MQTFSDYKRRKIARYYQDTNSIWQTIRHFNITYKELYKIIETTKILSYRIMWWKKYKICPTCKDMKLFTEDNFYKRKNSKYFYSSCKVCMNRLSSIYKRNNRHKMREKYREYYRNYYENNRNTVITNKRKRYLTTKYTILHKKKTYYKKNKQAFLKRILLSKYKKYY